MTGTLGHWLIAPVLLPAVVGPLIILWMREELLLARVFSLCATAAQLVLAAWLLAQAAGGDVGALAQSFLRAVWAEERDISDDAVIRDILGANGFDPSLADTGLFVGAETYGRNLEQAVAAGAFGAPFYVVRETDQRFWGQDRLDFLDRHLAAQ